MTVRLAYIGYDLSGVQVEIYDPVIVMIRNIFFFLDENSSRVSTGPLTKIMETQMESEIKEHIKKILKIRLSDCLEGIFDEKADFIMHPLQSLLPHDTSIEINNLFKKYRT